MRAEPELIREVAEKLELPASASVSQVIRYALAVVAGRPNPHEVAIVRPGPKPRAGAAV